MTSNMNNGNRLDKTESLKRARELRRQQEVEDAIRARQVEVVQIPCAVSSKQYLDQSQGCEVGRKPLPRGWQPMPIYY